MQLAFSNAVVSKLQDIEHSIAEIPDIDLLGAEGIVLRIHGDLWNQLLFDLASVERELLAQAEQVRARAPGLNVFALPDGHTFAQTRPPQVARNGPHLIFAGIAGPTQFSEVDAAMLRSIRHADLCRTIERAKSRCVICASGKYHFALPSGAHATQFLRLAEAFLDIETVDRLAYWVALEIQSRAVPLQNERKPTLVVDHPSMLLLGARVQLLVEAEVRLVTFPTYPSDQEIRTATFQLLDRAAPVSSNLFVLIGVSSTARLASTIADWSLNYPHTPVWTVVLYSLQGMAAESTFCQLNLPEYRHFAPGVPCELCVEESKAVAIQSTNYMIGYGHSSTVALPRALFTQQKEFLERWGAVPEALKVHFKDPNESTARHHAFYVDVGVLLNEADFLKEILDHIRAQEPQPQVVLIPDHSTAHRIANLIAQSFGWPVAVIGNTVSQGVVSNSEPLRSAASVLVVDDVFISGSRLDTINRILREKRTELIPALENLHYFTLLATPGSNQAYDRRRNGITHNHPWRASVTHLYKFPLPDWHTPKMCPWCREQQALSAIAKATGPLDDAVSERLSVLSDATSGLTTTALFMADEKTQIPTLGGGSVLMHEGASAIQVLFSCASAVQQARHANEALSPSQFPTPSFLAERVFFDHYTERLIWLCLLRSLRNNECEEVLQEKLRSEARNDVAQQVELVQAELAIAWLAGTLGHIDSSPATQTFFAELGFAWDALQKTRFVVAASQANVPIAAA